MFFKKRFKKEIPQLQTENESINKIKECQQQINELTKIKNSLPKIIDKYFNPELKEYYKYPGSNNIRAEIQYMLEKKIKNMEYYKQNYFENLFSEFGKELDQYTYAYYKIPELKEIIEEEKKKLGIQ